MNYNFNGNITVNGQPISAGGGVYLHRIAGAYDGRTTIDIITTDSTPFTYVTLAKYLYDNGYRSPNNCCGWEALSVSKISATQLCYFQGIYSANGTALRESIPRIDITPGTGVSGITAYNDSTNISTDTVYEL